LSEQLANRIWNLVTDWNQFARDTVGRQIIRVARGSLNETKHFLRRACRRGLLKEADIQGLRPLLEELSPELNAFWQSILREPGATDEDSG
jgi:hypothetical protein